MRASPYTDLARPPLSERSLRRALVTPGGLWTALSVTSETGSTNADVATAARAGAPEGLVLIAEHQSAGRGRLDRGWVAPARAGITLSVLLRPAPAVPPARLAWLALLGGVALVEAVGRIAVVDAALKWPNDLLVRPAMFGADELPEAAQAPEAAPAVADSSGALGASSAKQAVLAGYGKCAGVLAEAVADCVVLGIGLNVSQRRDELPAPRDRQGFPPTSLLLAGAACTDRDPIVRRLLRTLAEQYRTWADAAGDPDASGLREAYRAACITLGRDVRVGLPDGTAVAGTASDIDRDGRLVVGTPQGRHHLAAGDVRHVR